MNEIAPSVEPVGRHGAGAGAPAATFARPHAEPVVAGGDDDRIPRLFLGVCDLGLLTLSFLAANYFAPSIQRALLPGGALHGLLPAIFPIPPSPTAAFPPLADFIWMLAATAPVTLVIMEMIGGYERLLSQSRLRLMARVALCQGIAISVVAAVGFAMRQSGSSRVVIFTYGLFAAFGLIAYRAAILTYQQRRLARGVYAKNILLAGQPRGVELAIRHFLSEVPQTQFRLQGWLSARAAPLQTPERRRDDAARDIPLPRLGSVEEAGALLIHHPVHEIVVIQSSFDGDWLQQLIEHCRYFRIRLRIVPETLLATSIRNPQLAFRDDPLHLPEIIITPPYHDADALFVKRVIDIVVSATLLVLLAPLFAIIALAIKITTPHLSVFYPWHVIGFSGRPFTGYKFTTMVADADERKRELAALNEMEGPVFKVTRDPRMTALGRFLRKYSLNELPQLWSVLKGDMSLVGPRPAFRNELLGFELWHKRKLSVKPGITCLWQVSGRNRIRNFDDWVRLDLEYIDRWSLWLDMRILARTAWTVVSGSGS